MIQDGFITEGTSNNAYIITKDNVLITRNLSNDILAGVTRRSILRYAKEAQIKIEERPLQLTRRRKLQRLLYPLQLRLLALWLRLTIKKLETVDLEKSL